MSEGSLIELLYGKGAHASPLACIEDVPLELSGRRIDGFPHTIWQLVSHMNYWMDYELRRIGGEAPKYPNHSGPDWPVNPAPDGEREWKKAILILSELLGKLAVLAEEGPEELARDVEPTDPCHAKQASTLRDVLWQTLVHNSYHLGQITMLRQLLGAWPPKGGGDTW